MSKYVLNELLTNGLELVYAAHHQGAAQADASLRTSTFPALRSALEGGKKRNRQQATRLEKVFKVLGLTPKGIPDRAMQGLIDSNNELIGQTSNPTERDLINIASAQHAAHFYLAAYGPLRHYAKELGRGKAAKLLQKTLDETGEVNRKFTAMANEVIKHSQVRTEARSDSGLLATTIPAFVAVGLVGAAITYFVKQNEA